MIDAVANQRRVWDEWARSYGLDPEHVYAVALRTRPADTFAEVLPEANPAECLALLHELEDRDAWLGVYAAFDGAQDLLLGLSPGRWAIVTSNYEHRVRIRFTRTGLLLPDIIVDATSPGRGKPAADPYLHAASLLGARPEDCLVIEDSHSGIEAAHRAGMDVWAVNMTGTSATASRSFTSLAPAVPEILDLHRRALARSEFVAGS